MATAAQAGAGLNYYSSDAEYAASLAADKTVRYGSANIQWGRPASTANWEYGILGTDTVTPLSKGEIAWKLTNTFIQTATPLLNYTSMGNLTLAFTASTVFATTTARIAAGANTLAIRSILTPTGSLASVSMAGLQLIFSDGSRMDLGDAFASRVGDHIVYIDDRLAKGFKVTYALGFFNNSDMRAADAKPSLSFTLGYTDLTGAGMTADIFSGEALGEATTFVREGFQAGGGDAMRVWQDVSPAVPEPATWALMIAGFGMVGTTLRRRSAAAA